MNQLSDAEIRDICKRKIESLEYWLRRLIDETLTKEYGDFFEYKDQHGRRQIKKSIAESIAQRMTNEPSRYPRKVDAILLDDAISIICKEEFYQKHFRHAMESAFPRCNHNVVREFMCRLIDPRNRLYHANSISQRQYEKVVCYTGDIIDSIKKYYIQNNQNQEYNVPTILKVTDSFGNTFHRSSWVDEISPTGFPRLVTNTIRYNDKPEFYLRPGDSFSLEVEVDPCFEEDQYSFRWETSKCHNIEGLKQGTKLVLDIQEQDVSKFFSISCLVISNKTWHKHGSYDDKLSFTLTILPPI